MSMEKGKGQAPDLTPSIQDLGRRGKAKATERKWSARREGTRRGGVLAANWGVTKAPVRYHQGLGFWAQTS